MKSKMRGHCAEVTNEHQVIPAGIKYKVSTTVAEPGRYWTEDWSFEFEDWYKEELKKLIKEALVEVLASGTSNK